MLKWKLLPIMLWIMFLVFILAFGVSLWRWICLAL